MPENASLGPAGHAPKSEAALSWWWLTSILTATLFAAILFNNAEFVFQAHHYELNDDAANSLQVLKAKRFQELLGHYCRFGFHHPGPAFFYVYALGEALFYDAYRLVPTPFNAHFIMLYALSAFFFSATLSVVARRLGCACSKWFFGLALLLAAWHFSALYQEYIPHNPGFFAIWAPCVLVLPFLCFVVAAASVASGSGRDLPLMTLAGCFLVHGYVMMPFFVVPLSLLAYGGLTRGISWPWRAFPRQHWFAGAIIAVFLTPIVVDMVTVHPSNIQRLLDHMQTGYGERKSLLQSLLYFVHFGTYSAYPSIQPVPAFETFDFSGTVSFFRMHWQAYTLWLIVVLLPLAILLRRKGRLLNHVALANGNGADRSKSVPKFLLWIYIVLGTATALSIVWGCLMDGPMFYYVTLSNFALYYVLLLIFAIVTALWIEHQGLPHLLTPRSFSSGNWRRRVATLGPILFVLVAVAAFAHEAPRFRSHARPQDQQRLFAASIERALEIDPAQPKFLNFEWQGWNEAVGVALYLERRGRSWMVREEWGIMFGWDKVVTNKTPGPLVPTPSSSFWRIVRSTSSPSLLANDGRLHVLPLGNSIDLVIQPDLRSGAQIAK